MLCGVYRVCNAAYVEVYRAWSVPSRGVQSVQCVGVCAMWSVLCVEHVKCTCKCVVCVLHVCGVWYM